MLYAKLMIIGNKEGDVMGHSHETDLVILGAGPAGYSAAIYAARAALSPILITGLQPGGQLTITSDVENYPGFAAPILGPELMEQMRAQAENVGTKLHYDVITACDFSRAHPHRRLILTADSGDIYLTKSVILATGAQAKWLGLPSETRLRGAGVSACATCDGPFFKDKHVAVVGGGNTAVEEALYLTHHAKHVTLIHRRDSLRAERILQERLNNNPKISILWNSEVIEVIGLGKPETVSAIRLRNLIKASETTLNVEGFFVAIGHRPNTDAFNDQITCDEEGYIVTTPGNAHTSIPGVFAAGDVQDKTYRQAITAAGSGCIAALEAEKFLASL